MNDRILFVDKDAEALSAIKRNLRKQFHVETAEGGEEALQRIADNEPYAVIVTELDMPGMDGLEFLQKSQEAAPNSVGMILTDDTDHETAVKAVNSGAVFRFLAKPCPPEEMIPVLEAGLARFQVIVAEKDLLSQTLSGSVKVLLDILSLSKPMVFQRSASIRTRIRGLAKLCKIENSWECEIAAMLSQIGCVSMKEESLRMIYAGEEIEGPDADSWVVHPRLGHDLIEAIPRLCGVAKIVLYQRKDFEGSGFPYDDVAGEAIPIGARLLHLACDYELALAKWRDTEMAHAEVRAVKEKYDPELLEQLKVLEEVGNKYELVAVDVNNIPESGVVARDVFCRSGDLVVQRATAIDLTVRQRIRALSTSRGIQLPIWMFVPSHLMDTIEAFSPDSEVTAEPVG